MPRRSDQVREALLAVRCRAGQQEAWEELVHRFTPRLLYYLARFAEDKDLRLSLLQEVWLKAFRGIRSLKDENRLAAWLYGIAHRVAMNHFRDEYARQERACDAAVTSQTAQDDSAFEQYDNADLVHHALERIGWIEREVLTLLFLEGLSISEIAEVQGVPAGTVKSRLHRARIELRTVIESETALVSGETS